MADPPVDLPPVATAATTAQAQKPASPLLANVGADLLASVVVFLVALPLCMGIAIASGLPPTAGIITGIVGGLAVGALAGSPLQVSGPATGLTVLVWQLVQDFGLTKLGLIVLLAGLLQALAGAFGLGQWFRAVSPAVIHGMLAGIGVLILASQTHVLLDRKPIGSGIANLMGIPNAVMETFAAGDGHLYAAGIGVMSIVVMVLWGRFCPKKLKAVPAPLVAVLVAVAVAWILKPAILYVDVPANIWSVAHLPALADLSAYLDPKLLLGAVSIAFIASAETLLCATAVDQMHQGPRTRYDKELIAQGVGNTLCGVLGVLPMTGVIVRSGANVEAGAKTRLSAILHGAWLLLFVSVLPMALQLIPVSALAAVLVFTGYKLAYPKPVPELLRYGKTEVAIYVITIVMIVTTNLLTGVLTGLGLSLVKLLYAFSHLRIRVEDDKEANRTILHLSGAATLIRLPRLAATLETLRPSTEVHVHFEELDYIDHACLSLLTNWERQHEATGGSLVIEWEDLAWKYHQRRTVHQDRAAAAGATSTPL
jgi:MFS superfamily sulfate permease-like transporter